MIIPIKLPKEEKDELVRKVQAYFQEERSETIGDLGAELLLDFMIQAIGPHIYNKAVADVKMFVSEKFAYIEEEIDTLKRSTPRRR